MQDYTDGMLQSLTKGHGTASAATWNDTYDPTTLGLTQTTDPNGNVTSSSYDSHGNVLTNTNGLGKTWSYSYNSFNEQSCAAEPLAANPCSSLSPPSAITAGTATITSPSTAPPKYVTYREYDTDRNLIYTTTGDYAPGSGTASQSRTTFDLYNGESVTLGSNVDSCSTSAPSSELPCATINADGVVSQLGYNSDGDLTSNSTPNETQGESVGRISTVMGAPMGSVIARQTFQVDDQIATATIGGTIYVYVADQGDHVVRRINLADDTQTVVAGDYVSGDYGNGIAATSAELGSPSGVALDSSGDVAIADSSNNVIWFIPASTGTYFGQSMNANDVYTVAGNGTAGNTGNAGAATSAELHGPSSVAFDGSGIVIADTTNNEIRFVPKSSGTYFGQTMTGADIYEVAGNGTAGYSGNGAAATSAELHTPGGIAVDAAGDLVVSDTSNNVIRFVPIGTGTYFGQSMTADDIYTVAGNGTAGYSGDGGAATSAKLDAPSDAALDGSTGIVIADTLNNVVRFIPITTGTYFGQSMTANDVYTVVGTGATGNSGNGGAATSAHIDHVSGVAADASGDLLISTIDQSVARIVASSSGTLAGQSVTANDIYALAGTGNASIQNYSGVAVDGQLNEPTNVSVDASGDVFIADTNDNIVRFIPKASGTYYGQSMTANDVYTIAGNGTAGNTGNGGAATSAELSDPWRVVLDASGDLAIGEANDVRFIPKTSGTYFGQSMTANDIYTIAGGAGGAYSNSGGLATSESMNAPYGESFDAAGDLIVADTYNNVVRFVPVASGTYYGQSMTADHLYAIAGNHTAGYSGDGGAAMSAELHLPSDVVVDANGDLLIADSQNNVVRFVPKSSGSYFGQSMTANDIYTIAGTGTSGYSGNGGAATSAKLDNDADARFDGAGNLLIADSGNDVIRFVPKVSGEYYGVAMTGGDIYTIAGEGWGAVHAGGDGGPPLNAEFAWIMSVAPDGKGGFYIVDQIGNRVRYVSDAVPTSVSTTSYVYDADGEVTSVTAPNGNVTGANAANFTTTFTYDADGEVTASAQGGGTGATVTARTTDFGHDGDGNETSVTDPRGYVTSYTYNADDEQTLVTNAVSDASLTCYDGAGNVAETVPAVGVAADSLTPSSCPTSYPTDYGDRLATDATTYAFNALNEPTTETSPAPPSLSGYETTTNAYDLAGQLLSITAPPTSTSGGAPNDVTAYTYDAAGELLTTTSGYGTSSASTTSSCYDPDGEITATIPGGGNVSSVATCSTSSPYDTSSSFQTTYSFDSLGELVTQTAPATTAAPSGQITTSSYDPAGNVLTSTSPDGVTGTDTYSPLNQLLSVSYTNGTPNVTYSYDANGNLIAMVDGTGTTTNVYDPFDELTSTTDGGGDNTTYTYDLDGETTGITYPLGPYAWWTSSDAVAYTYDHADQLATVTDFNGHTSDVTENADGMTSALTLGSSGKTVNTVYAANNEPSTIELGTGSSYKFAYSDAPAGNVVSETDTPSSSLSPADYAYNAQSQVTSDTPGTGSALNYAEDQSGNLTTLPTGASGTFDDASELTSSVHSSTTTNYTYDASGNRTAESGGATVTATYNGAKELTSYDNSAADTTTASYNGNGLRTLATTTPTGGGSTTQEFVWNTTTSVPELLMDYNNVYIYGPNGTPFEQVNRGSGTIKYLVPDALGSMRGVLSAGGSLSDSTSYDAWGNPETSGGLTSYTPFGFAGGYTDPTGLEYFINRFYDPTTGQFINVDPDVAETGQPYVYASDNGLSNSDPLGLHDCGWTDPLGCVANTASSVWNDTGGYLVTQVHQHWRGVITATALIGGGALVLATGGAAFVVEGTVAADVLDAVATTGLIASTAANGYLCVTASGSSEAIACVSAAAGLLAPTLEAIWTDPEGFWSLQGKNLWNVGVGGATVVTGWATSVNQQRYGLCKI